MEVRFLGEIWMNRKIICKKCDYRVLDEKFVLANEQEGLYFCEEHFVCHLCG